MHVTTPQFVLLCQLLVREMEASPDASDDRRARVIDRLMDRLSEEGLVFDRAFAGQLYDQLVEEPELAEASPARVDTLRDRVRGRGYFTESMLETLGERLLWVLGSST